MTAPVALDDDGAWYLAGIRDTLTDIAAMAAPKDTTTTAHHTLAAIHNYCTVMLAKADDFDGYGGPPSDDVWRLQLALWGDDDE
jgi:hypothetical protein